MLANGDKLVVTKDVASFLKKGDIAKVINADESGMISFAFGNEFAHKGLMTSAEFEEHFEKIVEKAAPTVRKEMIEEIMDNSEITVDTVFDKCTIVACKLPNGFVIVESSACVSPENYDEELGVDICLEKIENKIWELEGYKLQDNLAKKEIEHSNDRDDSDCDDFCSCYEDCYDCPCHEDCCEDDEEDDDYYSAELDCNNCDDYSCPDNPRHNKYV